MKKITIIVEEKNGFDELALKSDFSAVATYAYLRHYYKLYERRLDEEIEKNLRKGKKKK
jgi:hypothetical protein